MMEPKPKWVWMLLITVLLLELGWSKGCLEHERIALLQLKSFFNDPYSLRGWVDIEGSDCCQWERVECSITSRRVTRLSLNATREFRYRGAGYGYLNSSLFLPFKELKSLYLSWNHIAGFVVSEGLSNLETLDLTTNFLKNDFLLHVSDLSSLRTLKLAYNKLEGIVNVQELNRLTNLRSLDLSGNKMESFESFKGSRRQLMKNLVALDLSYNFLQNSSFAYISRLSNLESLHLEFNELQGSIDIKDLNNLAKLKKLYMSYNQIESFRSAQDSERQLKLINLEELDLSSNFFDNSILAQFTGLSDLKSLNLGSNNLKGSTNLKELEVLKDLEELDLSNNELHEILGIKEIGSLRKLRVAKLDGVFINEAVSLPQVIEAFASVKTLSLGNNQLNKTVSTQELHLSSNVEELSLESSFLSNNILGSIGALTSLKTLMLSDCKLQGQLPNKGWCDLENLRELDLSKNELEGSFPPCLGNLTYLRFLDVSNNHFQVPTSFISFANLSHLKVLFINQNDLVREPSGLQTWNQTPKFQLQVFDMSNCTTKGLPKEVPNFIYYQYDLRFLDLSYNNINGKVPSWLLENNTRLQQVFWKGNSFTGPLHLPKHTTVDMFQIDLSQNRIQGQIPMNICSTFPNLEVLALFQNAFEGNIPPCLGDLKYLSTLDLSYNNFSGGIPEELAKSHSMNTLRLSSNNLSGMIIPTIFSSNALKLLYLDGNNFDGEIPLIDISTVSFPDLWDIDLSHNNLSGRLPIWILNVSGIKALDLSNNHLDGFIPFELCNLDWLLYLDLSQNNLSGSLPSCFNPPLIQHVHLSRNRLSGPLPYVLYNSSSLVTLDLSQNNFTGKIPYWIGTLSALSILVMKANNFEGKIPSQICQLSSLSIMDLSQNNLSGPIPSCLSNLTLNPRDDKYVSAQNVFPNEIRILKDLGFESRDSGQFYPSGYVEEHVEFMTKKGVYMFSGIVLKYMSGIDLSCNRLTGQIPLEIGNLSGLHSLNLSHNNLIGFIPSTISKLKQIESLDLSNNNLCGSIPIQLMELYSLAVFNVSYNNLSGSIPYKAQFTTFDESSYMENHFLCGPPLQKNCTKPNSSPTIVKASDSEEGGLVDKYVFLVSFLVSYGIVLMAIAIVLYINPYWRQAWFYFIQHCITTCHYFIEDHIL